MPLKVNNHNGKLLRKHKISNTTQNMNELQWVLWHYKEIKLVKKDYLNLGHKNRSFKSRLRIWQEAEDGKCFSVGVARMVRNEYLRGTDWGKAEIV